MSNPTMDKRDIEERLRAMSEDLNLSHTQAQWCCEAAAVIHTLREELRLIGERESSADGPYIEITQDMIDDGRATVDKPGRYSLQFPSSASEESTK